MQATLYNTTFKASEREMIDTFVDRIIHYYEMRDAAAEREGRGWYRYAQDFAHDVASETGISLKQAAYVIAVLSNNVTWERQLKSTIAFVKHVLDGGDAEIGFGFIIECQRKAARIILEHDFAALSGPKVTVFAANILGDYSQVTIDRHAVRVCFGRHTDDNETTKWVRAGSKGRAMLEAAYHEAARITREDPATLQAITWTVYRGSSGF